MSAHLCLMAWKLPIGPAELDPGLGVLDRRMSRHALGPAHLLGGQGDGGQVEGLGQAGVGPAVGADRARPACPTNSRRACLRVWSIVGSGVRVSPSASSFTPKSETPLSVRAATTIRSATWPSSTNILCPLRTHPPSPLCSAWHSIPPKSHRPLSSVMARVPMVSPEASPGRRYFLASSSPEVKTALAARATVEKKGAQSRAAPISSRTTTSST